MISDKIQIWLFWGCPKHNYVSQTNQLKACSNLMPFIKVEVYSIWKEWFLPFWRERNNWCETVSWAWLAHNLGTEGEKVFQTIPDPTTMFLQKSDKHIWPASKMFTGKEISIFNGLWHFEIGKSDEYGLFLLLWSLIFSE